MSTPPLRRRCRTSSLPGLFLVVVAAGIFGRISLSGLFSPDIQKLKDRRNIEALAHVLDNPDPELQYRAAEALGDLGDPAGVGPLVAAMSRSDYSGVRWQAAGALSKIGDPAVGPLISLLRHEDEDVRWQAAIALGEIRNPDAIEPLIALFNDRDRYVRSRAAIAVSIIGDPAIDRLIAVLREGDPANRWAAAIALGRTCSGRAVDPLIAALTDPAREVRAAAASGLSTIGEPATGPLLRFLKFTSGSQRIEGVRTLAALRAADAIEPLIQLLERAKNGEEAEIAEALDTILSSQLTPVATEPEQEKP